MARDLTPAVESEVLATLKRPVLFFEGEFATGTLRLWTGLGDIVWNSQTWTGAGRLISVSSIGETTEIRANGLAVSLSGVPTTLVSLVLAELRQNKPGRVWLGFLDATGGVVADPFLAFGGILDVGSISEDGETCTITITYESELVDLERPRANRYTRISQRGIYPGDQGFQYVSAVQEWNGKWGGG